ncbi:MAG: pyruvate kinase [Fibrobacter sp.]|nr:pyruvate kinase [Fibrobacter sp.]
MKKKVKIIATIGPSSATPEVIHKLLTEGTNIFRINFSHETQKSASAVILHIRQQAGKIGLEPAILVDLQGPKIRTGPTRENKTFTIQEGTLVRITPEEIESDDKAIFIRYPGLSAKIKKNSHILINDGAIRLRVEQIEKSGSIYCTALSTGAYSSFKGANFPGLDLGIPSLTAKDLNDLNFILDKDIQYIALSFVRGPEDLQDLREITIKKRNDLKIIAKIEKPEAAEKISDILQVCDGIMVARGDLGVETTPYSVPVIQKELIDKANSAGKLVIVATQMLESMIRSRIPTRAESTDVANAIIDGTDAIMLSGETAVGLYPVESVQTMIQIATITENSHYIHEKNADLIIKDCYPPHAICEAAAHASFDMGKIPICVFTVSGDTALYLSKIKPQAPIYAFSPEMQTVRMLSMAWNVTPFFLRFATDIPGLLRDAEGVLLNAGLVKKNDLLALVSGTTPVKGATNSLQIKRVGA